MFPSAKETSSGTALSRPSRQACENLCLAFLMSVDGQLRRQEVIAYNNILLHLDSIIQPLLPLVGHGQLPDLAFRDTQLYAVEAAILAGVGQLYGGRVLEAALRRSLRQLAQLIPMLLKKKCVAVGDPLFEYFFAHHLGRLVCRGPHFLGPLQVDLVDPHEGGVTLFNLLGGQAIAQSVPGLRPQDALLFLQVKLPDQLRPGKSRSLGGQHPGHPSEHLQVAQLL